MTKRGAIQKEDGAPGSRVQLHGLLYYAYRHATEWKLVKAVYWPDRKGCYTWPLQGLTGLLLAMLFSPLFCPVTSVVYWSVVVV
jgi:hypothetical protein